MSEEKEIEEILMEAHAHNLRNEVMDLAKKLMNDGTKRIQSYHLAYNTLIKNG